MDSIGLALAITATKGWEVHQMDVKNVFLHGDLFEEICMEQPQGFMMDSSLVYRLKKSLYGLKQALRDGMLRWTPTCCHVTLYVVNQTRMSTCSGRLIHFYF